ncbi:hypothetical protein [Nocardioides sp. Kera G14]|uniref:hypothetical protein n=1 Tax=Nocardioides sp. Kera G14 TaxID=2884264 RepID=UPI001D1097B3|nr:hypothetical protein [Nocardioides sp. Kera G14]UDY23897.1 hypothetical protein LH076_00940 [Nocardioides sp. Kera G14]
MKRLALAIVAMVVILIAAVLIATRLPDHTDSSEADDVVSAGQIRAERVRIRVNGVRSSAVTPLRAGDLITLHADVTTTGSASQWMRTALDFSGTDPELAKHLYVYDGPLPTGVGLKAAVDVTDTVTFPGYVGTADVPRLANPPMVLNGADESEAAGLEEYPLAVAIYVDPATPKELLERPLAMTATVQSSAYRAHPGEPANGDWSAGPQLPVQ